MHTKARKGMYVCSYLTLGEKANKTIFPKTGNLFDPVKIDILIREALDMNKYHVIEALLDGDLQSIHLHQCSCHSRPGLAGSHLHPDR